MKAKDFSDSAVKLTNPPEVKELLEKLSAEQATLEALNAELKANCGELIEKLDAQKDVVDGLRESIRGAVEEHGSYQDTENERYAVKYARKTAVYANLPSFKKNFPKFVELCVKETLDIQALKGQVKGKLITEADLERTKVLTWDESFAFYVR